jgi:hypothetical protein
MGLIHGQTAGLVMVPVLVDMDGTVHVNLVTVGVVPHVIVDSGALSALVSGQDVGAVVRVLRTDASGHLLVDGESPSLYRPLPKSDVFSNLNLPLHNSYQDAVTVPGSEYWRLTTISLQYVGTVVGVILAPYIYNGTNYLYFQWLTPIVSGSIYALVVNMLLSPGWKVGCLVVGATAGDDLYMFYFAERVY